MLMFRSPSIRTKRGRHFYISLKVRDALLDMCNSRCSCHSYRNPPVTICEPLSATKCDLFSCSHLSDRQSIPVSWQLKFASSRRSYDINARRATEWLRRTHRLDRIDASTPSAGHLPP